MITTSISTDPPQQCIHLARREQPYEAVVAVVFVIASEGELSMQMRICAFCLGGLAFELKAMRSPPLEEAGEFGPRPRRWTVEITCRDGDGYTREGVIAPDALEAYREALKTIDRSSDAVAGFDVREEPDR
jgi:hypothetical protein